MVFFACITVESGDDDSDGGADDTADNADDVDDDDDTDDSDDDATDDTDDDTDDDVTDDTTDDATDDTGDDCTDGLTALYDCGYALVDGDGVELYLDVAILACQGGDTFAVCAAGCGLVSTCDTIEACVEDNCY